MPRSPRTNSVCLALLALTASCTFADGDPWGRLDLTLEVAFDPSEREDAQTGRLRIGDGYEAELGSLTLEVSALSVRLLPSGASAAFDPADPPPEYSLCHNGHCHHEDGRLVDYEDIALELAGAQAAAGPAITQAIEAEVTPSASGTDAPLGVCAQGCETPRGELGSLSVNVTTVRVSGRAFDAREARLPDEGVAFTWEVALPRAMELPLEGSIDRGQPVALGLDARLEVTDKLLDGVDWTQITQGQAPPAMIQGALASRFLEDSTLTVKMTKEP